MRVMGLAGWSRPSVPTTITYDKTPCDEIKRSAANGEKAMTGGERMRKLCAGGRALHAARC